MISYDFVPISSQKGVLFFETPGICINYLSLKSLHEQTKLVAKPTSCFC